MRALTILPAIRTSFPSLLVLICINQLSATDVVCFFESKTSMPQAATPTTFKTLGDQPVSLWTGSTVKKLKKLKFNDTVIVEFPQSLIQDFPGRRWMFSNLTGQKVLVPFNDVWVNQNIPCVVSERRDNCTAILWFWIYLRPRFNAIPHSR